MSTITITRAERDLIHELLGYWAPGVESMADPVPFGTRDEADESIRKLRFAADLFDELGWAEDDPRQSFTVTVRPEIIERVRSIRDGAEYMAARGQDDLMIPPEYRDEVRMCEDLLARLDTEAVTS